MTRVLLCVAGLCLFASCATQSPIQRPFAFEAGGHGYSLQSQIEEPTVDLSKYKNVQTRAGGQNPGLALAVCISGGGHRAANFALGVLGAMESIPSGSGAINLLREIDYFSTVSGGGLAAGIYLSSLHDFLLQGGTLEDYSLRDALLETAALQNDLRYDPQLRRYTQDNYHKVLIEGLATMLTFGAINRGDYLERAFDERVLGKNWRSRLMKRGFAPGRDPSLTLGDLFIPRDSDAPVRLPYWFANATVFENGALFPFTPDVLQHYQITGYRHNLSSFDWPGEPDYFSIPLSVGLKASATYPVAVPSTTMKSAYDPDNPYLHLYDGGMSDEKGIITALRALTQDSAPRKALIVIDAFNSEVHPFSNQSSSPSISQILLRWSTDIPFSAQHVRYREMPSWIALELENHEGQRLELMYMNLNLDMSDNNILAFIEKSQLEYSGEEMRALADLSSNPSPASRLRDNVVVETLSRPPVFAVGLVKNALQPILNFSPFPMLSQARSVRTSLNITPEEQTQLLFAGKIVVDWKAEKGEWNPLLEWFDDPLPPQ